MPTARSPTKEMPSRLLLLGCPVPVRQTSHLALSSKFRPRLDQERRHSGGDQHCDRDSRKDHLIALRPVVDGAGDERAEDRAPGVEEIHVAGRVSAGPAISSSSEPPMPS